MWMSEARRSMRRGSGSPRGARGLSPGRCISSIVAVSSSTGRAGAAATRSPARAGSRRRDAAHQRPTRSWGASTGVDGPPEQELELVDPRQVVEPAEGEHERPPARRTGTQRSGPAAPAGPQPRARGRRGWARERLGREVERRLHLRHALNASTRARRPARSSARRSPPARARRAPAASGPRSPASPSAAGPSGCGR